MDDESRFWTAKVSDPKYHADVHELFKAERSRAKLHSISQLTAHRPSMLELKVSFGAKRSNLRWCMSEVFGSVGRFIITRWSA